VTETVEIPLDEVASPPPPALDAEAAPPPPTAERIAGEALLDLFLPLAVLTSLLVGWVATHIADPVARAEFRADQETRMNEFGRGIGLDKALAALKLRNVPPLVVVVVGTAILGQMTIQRARTEYGAEVTVPNPLAWIRRSTGSDPRD